MFFDQTVMIPALWALTFDKYPLLLLPLTNKNHCPASETLPLFLVAHTQTCTHRLSRTLPNCLMWIIQLDLDSLTAYYRGQRTEQATATHSCWRRLVLERRLLLALSLFVVLFLRGLQSFTSPHAAVLHCLWLTSKQQVTELLSPTDRKGFSVMKGN